MVNVKDYGAAGDGKTDDSKAIIRALAVAQTNNLTLYFPAGSYNLNGGSLQASKNLIIAGDSNGSATLLNPGNIVCNKNVNIQNLNIRDDANVFLNIKPAGMVNIYISNVNYYGNTSNSRFIYCYSDTPGIGVQYVQINDCNILNTRYGIMLKCQIDSGLITRNSFDKIGSAELYQSTGAIVLGFPNSDIVFARNVTISENRITNVTAAFSTTNDGRECQGMLIYSDGGCVIKGNYLENILGGMDTEGIYCKAVNVKILNNILINAGEGNGSIVVKKDSPNNDIIISGNTINNGIDSTLMMKGILVTGSKYTISNNDITMKSGIAIYANSNTEVLDSVIINNTIQVFGRTAIYVPYVIGSATISGNIINHIHQSIEKQDATINLSKAAASAEISVTQNLINVENTRLFNLYQSSASADYEISGNTLSTSESFTRTTVGVTSQQYSYVLTNNKIDTDSVTQYSSYTPYIGTANR
jgi:hypothetical protein